MVKTFWKTIKRSLLRNKGRFLGNFLVVFISLALTSGLGALTGQYEKSFSENYINGNAPDLTIKFLKEIDVSSFTKFTTWPGIESVEAFSSLDTKYDDSYARIYWRDFSKGEIALPSVIEGRLPTNSQEILVEKGNLNRRYYSLNEEVKLDTSSLFGDSFSNQTYKIVGIVDSALYNSVIKERAMTESEDYLNSIFYFDISSFQSGSLPLSTDVYVRLDLEHEYFSSSYIEKVKSWKSLIESYLKDSVLVTTIEENSSFALFKGYNEKVSKIALVFPFFFIIVCALVNLLTITRYVKDERAIIGTYRSLGISKGKIIFKYSLFSFLSVSLGALSGYLLGTSLLPIAVLPAYQAVFEMQSCAINFSNLKGIVIAVATLLISLLITISTVIAYLKETPASLLKEKAPKAGKKIFLEKIPFLWKKITFSYKNSFRNIFRNKKNSLLTALSIFGSTFLVLIGFSLLDVSKALINDEIYANVASSMGSISTLIIIFALAMTISVIYLLTNMNIQDRQRELATLKVLGYHSKECSLYTFREIMIISLSSSLIALPLGALIIAYVFDYLEFGGIEDVQWYSYLCSFLIINVATVLTNLFLYPKIKAIDMNTSLKSLD